MMRFLYFFFLSSILLLNTSLFGQLQAGDVVQKGTANYNDWFDNLKNNLGNDDIENSNFSLSTIPVFNTADTMIGVLSLPFTRIVVASDDTQTYEATGLPNGLSMNPITGLISGTPLVAGIFTISLTASNAAGIATRDIVLIIKSKLLISPFGDSITQSDSAHNSYRYPLWKKLIDADVPFSFVGSKTTNFNGNPAWASYNGIVFDSINEGHWGVVTRKFSEMLTTWLINYTPDIVLLHLGTNDVGITPLSNSQTNLTSIIQKTRARNPDVAIFIAKLIPRNGVVPTDFNDMVAALAATLTTVRSPIIVVDHSTGFNTDTDTWDQTHPNGLGEEKMARRWFEAIVDYLGVQLAVPVITSATTLIGNVNTTFNYAITATNNPTNYSATDLPEGLVIDNYTGIISGTPTIAGTYTITVSAVNSGGTVTQPVTLIITAIDVSPLGVCPGSSLSLLATTTPVAGNVYQWQINSGAGFISITDNDRYTGALTDTLSLINVPSGLYGNLYRCMITNGNVSYSQPYTLKFANTWIGAVDTAWETAGNWSCGTVPDINSDVHIHVGSAIIDSNVSIRSLTVDAGVQLTVNTGKRLTIVQ